MKHDMLHSSLHENAIFCYLHYIHKASHLTAYFAFSESPQWTLVLAETYMYIDVTPTYSCLYHRFFMYLKCLFLFQFATMISCIGNAALLSEILRGT